MRYLFLLLLGLLLSGCQHGRFLNPSEFQARDAFLQGFETWNESGSADAWEPLQRDYPESAWTARARDLADLKASVQQQREALAELESKNKRLGTTAERCRQENKKLQQNIDLLRENIAQLKQLLVDYELRAK
ncbi:hypothetical protein [Desulfuromonas sp. AOP6]|uniref:hypothetical protein n=1 Tax=Desulfuromonas sp. AOP6 TaxID=1566351 RepID=UPI001287C82E|nr:hypothetical protein [Desulfuromonas sp. AOP6]BCA79182.1 hypothetical protein AOP6_0969 [Desulfuromonas sp. AOP6]